MLNNGNFYLFILEDIQFTPWFRLIYNAFLMKWWDNLNEDDILHSIADKTKIYTLE